MMILDNVLRVYMISKPAFLFSIKKHLSQRAILLIETHLAVTRNKEYSVEIGDGMKNSRKGVVKNWEKEIMFDDMLMKSQGLSIIR